MSSRVLVVDDDPTVAEVVTSYLRRAGFAVDHASEGPRWRSRRVGRPIWWCLT